MGFGTAFSLLFYQRTSGEGPFPNQLILPNLAKTYQVSYLSTLHHNYHVTETYSCLQPFHYNFFSYVILNLFTAHKNVKNPFISNRFSHSGGSWCLAQLCVFNVHLHPINHVCVGKSITQQPRRRSPNRTPASRLFGLEKGPN